MSIVTFEDQSLPSSFLQKESSALRRRLLGLMLGRLLFSTLLMGATVVYQLKSPDFESHPTKNLVFWLVGLTYFLTLIYSLLFTKARHYTLFALLQLWFDVLVLSALVVATGSQDSPFLFCYLLVIIGAALLLSRRETLFFAAFSLACLGLILLGSYWGLFEAFRWIKSPLPIRMGELAYISLVYGTSFFLVALLASHLAEQARHTKEILQKQQIDLDNLEALQRDILMSLRSGLITTDAAGSVQFFNPRAQQITGLRWEDVFLRKVWELFPALDGFNEQGLRKEERLEFRYQKEEDEEPKILGVSISILRDSQEEDTGFLLLFQDLTPVRKMEEAAKRQERMALVGRLAAGLAHEIRNPLSSLSGAIQLLNADLELSGESEKLIQIVMRETRRLDQLLGEFLLFARPRELDRQRFRFAELFQESLFLFSQDGRYANVTVESDFAQTCWIEVDNHLFHQVLWNLLLNAAQAMQPDGGVVKVGAKEEEGGAWVSVCDQGKGIALEVREKIFEPFFSTKEQGTGLGLAIVQRVVLEHEGRIVYTEEDGWVCFRLFFPYVLEKESLLQESHSEAEEVV